MKFDSLEVLLKFVDTS